MPRRVFSRKKHDCPLPLLWHPIVLCIDNLLLNKVFFPQYLVYKIRNKHLSPRIINIGLQLHKYILHECI